MVLLLILFLLGHYVHCILEQNAITTLEIVHTLVIIVKNVDEWDQRVDTASGSMWLRQWEVVGERLE